MVSSRERGAGAVSVLLIRRRRPIGEPAALLPIDDTDDTAAVTLEGTAGAGRIAQELIELGYSLDSVMQAVIPADIALDSLTRLDLGRRFEIVVLGSHLVNLPDAERRAAFLALVGRHLADSGVALVEHHPIDWAETAEDVRPTPGSGVGMEDVRRDPPYVSAVSTFDIGGRFVRQPFTARVLGEAELAGELEASGLAVRRRLSPTWLAAGPDRFLVRAAQ
jgi:hypothetical protein